MQVNGVSWRSQDDGSFVSGLRVWNDSNSLEFIPIVPGENVSWIFRGPRRCIGSIDAKLNSVPCPEEAVILQSGMQRCGPCSSIDFVDPCIRCDGRLCLATSERRSQCNDTSYVVYLAVFNDETLKVGVSSEKRVRTRWVEQGADFGGVLHVVKGGIYARKIEDRLGQSPSVAKQVRGERKIRGLSKRMELESAQSIVDQFLLQLELDEIKKEVKLEDLSRYYSLSDFDTTPNPWRKRSEKIDDSPLLGEVVGMKGSLIITCLASSYTVTDLKQVIGYTVDHDDCITMVTQTGLGDFC
ncbi:MAG: DUF2797 domain-containing protein [Candidatus Thorarchaeota archaeon]